MSIPWGEKWTPESGISEEEWDAQTDKFLEAALEYSKEQQLEDELGSMSLWVETVVREKRELKRALDSVLNSLGSIYKCSVNTCEGCKEDIYQAVQYARAAVDRYRPDMLGSDKPEKEREDE